ncbi:efflux RND transporter periplasmic adaptor subunit [Paramaledivibacter caminithermalis]|jgi:RND family efflux transporter MFP subunit|uniref:RND family efflux transporter, MFP subunit n=1 Tax=Paramaledivibacter caminithermalis (strain DSM 15212 / CIP 107654 / DViRD3) TaxID=1121301 RepID=A0A1M6PMQ9_PARC5|nr:efflux RND transporter periplasmic adaptor subunit [Paramaledivibacter caminithermalis]SHK09234.1 RND family efflux transporter, MFP subunit [Paramaledivibacter caminithermalis DSM 15212]
MNKKILFSVQIILILVLTLTGCSKTEEVAVEEKVRAVKAEEIKESEMPVLLSYLGTVDSQDIVKYGFKTPGKLGRIFVNEGDEVKKGDKLAQLDIQDLQFQFNAAKSTLEAADLNVQKAKDAYEYAQSLLARVEKLYKKGSVTEDSYDKAKLQVSTTEHTYNQAQAQYQKAKTDYSYKKSLLEDATLYADQDGSVVKVPFEESELIPQGYPVVVVRSVQRVVNVGIAQKDLNKINIGMKAYVEVDGQKAEGIVTNIAEAPDAETRTYNAEVTVQGNVYKLGSIAKVDFDLGKEKAIWIPVTCLLSNGENYVYVVRNGRAFKTIVELERTYGDHIRVKGLKAGDMVVTSGMKNLSDGIKVKVIGREGV